MSGAEQMSLRSRKIPPGAKPKTATSDSQSPPPAAHGSPQDSRGRESPANSKSPSHAESLAEGQECDPIVVIGDSNNEDGAAATQGGMPNLELFFREATARFENTIKVAVDSFISKLKEVESNLGESLEFERQRVDNLQKNQEKMEKTVNEMATEISRLKSQMEKYEIAANKNERFARRNNIRLVGVPEAPEGQRDDCVKIAEETLRTHFNLERKVERSHRDGRKVEGRDRHVLIKLLSYRDKVEIMRKNREALKNKTFFIVDDLTAIDLREKQKWGKQVQDLYRAGTRLRFYAGKWRQAGGTPYNFS